MPLPTLKVQVFTVIECESCGGRHDTAHLITVDGGSFYYCVKTEGRVLVSIEPLQPA